MAAEQPTPQQPQSSNLQRAFAERIRLRFFRRLWVRIAIWVAGLLLLFAFGFWVYMYLSTMQGYYLYKTVDMNPTLPRFNTGETDLFTLSRGDSTAPPILVVHDGPGWDMHGMERLNALQDSFRVIYYDQRGTGQSQRLPREQLQFDAHLRDLDTLSRHFARQQPVRLVGQGWGSLLIAAYLSQYPSEHIHSAMLLAPPAFAARPAAPIVEDGHGLNGLWTHIEINFIEKHIWIKGDPTAAADYTLMYYDRRNLPRYDAAAEDSTVPIIRAGADMRAVIDSLSAATPGWYQAEVQSLKASKVPIRVIMGKPTARDADATANQSVFPESARTITWEDHHTQYPLNTYPKKTIAHLRAFWHELRAQSTSADSLQRATQ